MSNVLCDLVLYRKETDSRRECSGEVCEFWFRYYKGGGSLKLYLEGWEVEKMTLSETKKRSWWARLMHKETK